MRDGETAVRQRENVMNGQNNEHKPRYIWYAIPIGVGAGITLGIVFSTILGNPGFFALGIGIGTTLGITISLASAQERKK
ncbi:MAG: hypothetical protein WAM60_08685 [Candidatus Promineifilaceae bacterium]